MSQVKLKREVLIAGVSAAIRALEDRQAADAAAERALATVAPASNPVEVQLFDRPGAANHAQALVRDLGILRPFLQHLNGSDVSACGDDRPVLSEDYSLAPEWGRRLNELLLAINVALGQAANPVFHRMGKFGDAFNAPSKPGEPIVSIPGVLREPRAVYSGLAELQPTILTAFARWEAIAQLKLFLHAKAAENARWDAESPPGLLQ